MVIVGAAAAGTGTGTGTGAGGALELLLPPQAAKQSSTNAGDNIDFISILPVGIRRREFRSLILSANRHQASSVRDASSETADMSPNRACRITIAAMAAVSVRSTRGPKPTRQNAVSSNASS